MIRIATHILSASVFHMRYFEHQSQWEYSPDFYFELEGGRAISKKKQELSQEMLKNHDLRSRAGLFGGETCVFSLGGIPSRLET